jgi:hypothetical protein
MKRLIAVLAVVGTLGPAATAPADQPAKDIGRPRMIDGREARGGSYYVAHRSPAGCFPGAGPWQLHGPYDFFDAGISEDRLSQEGYETMVLSRSRKSDGRGARGSSYYVAHRPPAGCFPDAGPWQLHGPYERIKADVKEDRLAQKGYETMVLRAESRRPALHHGVGEEGSPRRRPSVSRPRMRFG